ncbi:oxidoreductase [Entomoplasma ellychniae]|uniref:Oxidoreductase n=1 Tax=Entomoplasma ellychniae TaxID=2114 RepID=A0A8E2R036_9MOLU|nr:Gfo/Idh/MocA family oxidoreductase [Entomoplasma ellychniae]PPE05005.1 oxidoreductase [Entomoplasma ellychniae]
MKFATIGTGDIVKEFIKATKSFDNLNYGVCYSRTLPTAKIFLKNIDEENTIITTSFEEIVNQKVDFVYIASPNGLHYSQALFFLKNKINVLLEKPVTFLKKEILELTQLANKNKVILLEAIKTIHSKEFEILKEMSINSKATGAFLNANQYSSRMSKINKNIFDSVFDAELGKGNTYDILIYPVEMAIALFGEVKEVKSISKYLKNGVSIADYVLIQHVNGNITSINSSKNNFQTVNSQIYSEDQTLEIKGIVTLDKIISEHHIARVGRIEISRDETIHPMIQEIQEMIHLIKTQDFVKMNYWLNLSIQSIEVLEKISVINSKN